MGGYVGGMAVWGPGAGRRLDGTRGDLGNYY